MAKYIIGVIVVLVALIAVFDSATTISAGEQGVVTSFGKIKGKTLSPGIHFVTPFVDKVHIFTTRETKEEISANAASRDLQAITVTVALNYHLDPAQVNQLFQEIGKDYKSRIIDPAIQESVKASTANYTAEEAITKRGEVKERIKNILSERLRTRFIIVDDVSIVNFAFSGEFDKSIEAKQVAEQNALKAKQDLERVKIEAEQKIAQARAEAEGLRLQKDQITPELIQLRQVEAQIKAIEKWNGQLPTYSMGNSVPLINLPAAK